MEAHGLSKGQEDVGWVGQECDGRLVQRPASTGLRAELARQDRAGGRKKVRKVKSRREAKYTELRGK